MKRSLLIAALVLGMSTLASAENGLSRVVKLLETRYAVRHHGVPGLWLSKPFLIGSGVGGLKIAEFNNLRVPATDMHGLEEDVRKALGPEWQPFVESFSAPDHEWSVIYVQTKAGASAMQMLIASGEATEFTLVQMKLSGRALRDWLDEPVKHAKHTKSSKDQTVETGVSPVSPGSGGHF